MLVQTLTGLNDGVYIFSVATAGAEAGYQSSVQFTVGAPRPSVVINAAPPLVSASPLAQFAFTSSGDVAFECSLRLASSTAILFSACISPKCPPPPPPPPPRDGQNVPNT